MLIDELLDELSGQLAGAKRVQRPVENYYSDPSGYLDIGIQHT